MKYCSAYDLSVHSIIRRLSSSLRRSFKYNTLIISASCDLGEWSERCLSASQTRLSSTGARDSGPEDREDGVLPRPREAAQLVGAAGV